MSEPTDAGVRRAIAATEPARLKLAQSALDARAEADRELAELTAALDFELVELAEEFTS